MPKVVPYLRSIQYDGTNGAYIAGTWCTGITLFSDTGTAMVFADGDNGTHHTVELNDWLVAYNTTDINPTIFTAAAYADRYYELP